MRATTASSAVWPLSSIVRRLRRERVARSSYATSPLVGFARTPARAPQGPSKLALDQDAAEQEVRCRRAQLRPVEAREGVAVVRLRPQELGVLRDREVVVAKILGLLRLAHAAGAGAACRERGHQNKRERSLIE